MPNLVNFMEKVTQELGNSDFLFEKTGFVEFRYSGINIQLGGMAHIRNKLCTLKIGEGDRIEYDKGFPSARVLARTIQTHVNHINKQHLENKQHYS